MPDHVLELSSLPVRHPDGVGDDLLKAYGPAVVCRLSLDPTKNSPGEFAREVQVNWVTRPGRFPPVTVNRSIGWAGADEIVTRSTYVARNRNEHQLTEQAAIGVMALLLHDLEESSTLIEVLRIGSGADYLVRGPAGEAHIEVSGIRNVEFASQAMDRFRQKCGQLLQGAAEGYVSVTTFSHPTGPIVHSFLHFISRPAQLASKKKRRGKDKETAMVPVIDADSRATRAALQGDAALNEGDTALAREKFSEAGEILAKRAAAAPDASTRALARFLAASQYYHGGEYGKAQKLCQKIDASELPARYKNQLPPFASEVARRAKPAYREGIQADLARAWKAQDYNRVLRLLQDHPFALDPADLAYVRSQLFEELGEYEAAAAQLALACKLRPELLTSGFSGLHAFALFQSGRTAAGRKYADLLSKAIPHALTICAAAVIRLLESIEMDRAEGSDQLAREGLDLFEQARERFRDLLPEQRAESDVRLIMHLAFQMASLRSMKLGEDQNAREIIDEGLAYWPESAELWTVRVALDYFQNNDLRAARRAVELGSSRYEPYYFLSRDAFDRGDYGEAYRWAREAMARLAPGEAAAARLYAWTAACLAASGGPNDQADSMFRKAIEIDPADNQVQDAYDFFQSSAHQPPDRYSTLLSTRYGDDVPLKLPKIPRRQPVERLLAH